MNCIFVDRPKECVICLRERQLKCLVNKQHLIVRSEAKAGLLDSFLVKIDYPDRHKIVPGEAGRKRQV